MKSSPAGIGVSEGVPSQNLAQSLSQTRYIPAPERKSRQQVPQDCVEVSATVDTSQQPLTRLRDLPRDVGWLLMTAGVIGELAPGVLGTPFWVAGLLVEWPRLGRPVERWLERRAPRLWNRSLRQLGRFLDDLDRRYPVVGPNRRPAGPWSVDAPGAATRHSSVTSPKP